MCWQVYQVRSRGTWGLACVLPTVSGIHASSPACIVSSPVKSEFDEMILPAFSLSEEFLSVARL